MQTVSLCPPFKALVTVPVVLRAVGKITPVIKYLAEVLEPSAVYHGTVGQNECPPEIHVLDHLQGGQGLAETHLGVPQHLIAFLELPLGLVDGFPLLGTEDDWASPVCHLSRQKGFLALLDGCDGTFHNIQVGDEPFVGSVHLVKHFLLYAGTLQYDMDFLVVE